MEQQTTKTNHRLLTACAVVIALASVYGVTVKSQERTVAAKVQRTADNTQLRKQAARDKAVWLVDISERYNYRTTAASSKESLAVENAYNVACLDLTATGDPAKLLKFEHEYTDYIVAHVSH